VFNRLPESNARPQRRAGGAIVSTIVHFVLIALAVRATGLRATPVKLVPPVIDPVFVDPKSKEPTPPADSRPTTPSSGSKSPVPVATILPVPTIEFPVTGIPEPGIAIDLTRHGDFDPTATVVSNAPPGGSPNVSDGSALPKDLVEKAVIAIPGTATPRYPTMLQGAGVEGDVRAQFIVDTLGRVEQGSVRVLDSTHDLFAAAVRDALERARFKPAEAGGHKVRQLAEQVFTFRITK
jgi:periplasmic protein TonB